MAPRECLSDAIFKLSDDVEYTYPLYNRSIIPPTGDTLIPKAAYFSNYSVVKQFRGELAGFSVPIYQNNLNYYSHITLRAIQQFIPRGYSIDMWTFPMRSVNFYGKDYQVNRFTALNICLADNSKFEVTALITTGNYSAVEIGREVIVSDNTDNLVINNIGLVTFLEPFPQVFTVPAFTSRR